ncbi:hypothetical protein [Roseateles noduli]|uniref:hypothetical protein n=1 Tax=Roseateles noduli TaxID=2052484 RepID=UPI003D64D9D6
MPAISAGAAAPAHRAKTSLAESRRMPGSDPAGQDKAVGANDVGRFDANLSKSPKSE